MKEFKIDLPIFIEGKKKRYYLSLNGYRNWHHFISNDIKKRFKAQIRDKLKGLELSSPYFEYTLYYPDKRKRDKMNYIAVIDKFFLDALVEEGCLPDDNDDFTNEVVIRQSRIDKDNPRCECIIKEF